MIFFIEKDMRTKKNIYYINNKPVPYSVFVAMQEEEQDRVDRGIDRGINNNVRLEDCEDECDDENCCPRCSMMMEVVEEIRDCEDDYEALEVLREFVDMVENVAVETELRSVGDLMYQIADDFESQDYDGEFEG